MHVMEGFLPPAHCALWAAASIPVVAVGLAKTHRITRNEGIEPKLRLAAAGACIFLLSALKLPSVTGSCSHPTGVGIAAILFGPTIACALSLMVLLMQALLLAHGGLSTLGANVFSMGIAGPLVAYGVYRACSQLRCSQTVAFFGAGALGDLTTYVVTSVQLGLAFPMADGDVKGSILRFLAIFVITQVPLAIADGAFTAYVLNRIKSSESNPAPLMAAGEITP